MIPRRIFLFLWLCANLLFLPPLAAAYDVMDRSSAYNPVEQLFAHIRTGKWDSALAASAAIGNPVLQKYTYWRYLRDESTAPTFEQITQFLSANPNWPMSRGLMAKAEGNIPSAWTADQIITWFNANPAITFDGKRKLAEAWLDKKNPDIARPLLRQYWREANLNAESERQFRKQYSGFLQTSDDQARLDNLIRNKSYTAARQLAKLLGDGFPQLAEVKIALLEKKPTAAKLLAKVPAKWQSDPGLLYLRLKRFRQDDRDISAIAILNKQPADLGAAIEDWWDERQILTRRMLRDQDFAAAYQLVSRHGLSEGASYVEGEFLSGWIALQKLRRPDLAVTHFKNIHDRSPNSIALSRAYYWMGRAYQNLNQPEMARTQFLNASQYPSSFYGQLARQYLGNDTTPFELPKLPALTAEQWQDFNSMELPQIIRILNAINEKQAVDVFAMQMASTAQNAAQMAPIIKMTADLRRPDLAVAIARQSRLKGIDLIEAGFPIVELAGGKDPEAALVYSIIRQESSFNTAAVSSAGAMGLMQLMPATAKTVAKRNGIAFRKNWLIDRPEYNVTLGKILLDGKIKSYDGSYALAIAAYNAGPGNVREWIENYGDPRNNNVDLVDWIENIPFGETRNYVHRVLENMVIYRYLLDQKQITAAALSN